MEVSSAKRLSVRQRVRPNLEVDHFGHGSLSSLAMEWRARTPRGPDTLALPPRLRIVNSTVHSFCEEAQRIRDPHYYEFSGHQRNQRIGRIAGNNGCVPAQPERIELVHPIIIVRVRAPGVLHVLEVRPRGGVKSPAFRTVLSGGVRTVERAFAFAPVEAGKVPAASATQATLFRSISIPRGE